MGDVEAGMKRSQSHTSTGEQVLKQSLSKVFSGGVATGMSVTFKVREQSCATGRRLVAAGGRR